MSSHVYQDAQSADNFVVVKVRFTFNFAVSVPYGSSYAMLIDKIGKKLNLPSTVITLRYNAHQKKQKNKTVYCISEKVQDVIFGFI